jgi:hypothetical protein
VRAQRHGRRRAIEPLADRTPRGTARVLLDIIDREPKTVLRALAPNGIGAA